MSDKNYKIIKSSRLFNEKWYKNTYLKNTSEDPIKHYLEKGCKNNFNPSSEFNTKWYLDTNKDVKEIGMNPFVHYIVYGRKEGRLPNKSFDLKTKDSYALILYSGLFDEEWFSKYYSLENTNIDPIKYYLDYCLVYGLNPSPDFDSMWYLEEYEDVKKVGMNPFAHYILYGKKEGRLPKL